MFHHRDSRRRPPEDYGEAGREHREELDRIKRINMIENEKAISHPLPKGR